MPPKCHLFSALLFDLDGTLIDSTAAVVRHWTTIGNSLGIDPSAILATSHGRRTIDVLCSIDPSRATMAYAREMEAIIPRDYASDAVILPGTLALIHALKEAGAKWGIVTSGTSVLAEAWLKVMGLDRPEVMVTADAVENGKPDPEGYLKGKKELIGEGNREVAVFEDAPAGIRAGKAAGCMVIGLLTTHTKEEVVEAGADWVVEDLSQVEFSGVEEKGIRLKIGGEKISR